MLDADGMAAAQAEIASWPGYAPTPLVPLAGLAARAGVAALHYKDEAHRFGLESFKALGGAYAVGRLLERRPEAAAEVTVCTATDGNHGRSVAWGAQMFGCRCVVYIHATVSEGRKRAIERFGAEVRRIAGNYDDSVRRAAADAAANGWCVVSDTSYEGYLEIPRDVMHGYTLMAAEALAQWPAPAAPTHVFVQGGVGGVAAAVCAVLWQRFGRGRPRLVVVEPEPAACLFASARAGRRTGVGGDLDTVMAGLAAGEPSWLAWDVLAAGADDFMTVDDDAAMAVLRLLADGVGGDAPLVAGESAVAGIAALLAAADDRALGEALGLDAESRVLVFGTEGATDPEVYARIVGRAPEEVAA